MRPNLLSGEIDRFFLEDVIQVSSILFLSSLSLSLSLCAHVRIGVIMPIKANKVVYGLGNLVEVVRLQLTA